MEWYYELEERLISSLLAAARSVVPEASHVELDFLNGFIQVVIPKLPSRKTKLALEDAFEAVGRPICPGVVYWPVESPFPPVVPYSSHLMPSPRVVRPFGRPESIIVFDIPLSQLRSLRSAESFIAEQCGSADYVVAFALGGISLLIRLSGIEWERAMPPNPFEVPGACRRFADRFHLFPGLVWSESEREAGIFTDWLGSLPEGRRVLVFDTGSSGNGARRAARVIREAVEAGKPIRPAWLRVVGVVDRTDDPDQKPADDILRAKEGNDVRLSVEYRHVGRLLSEDCERLLGHDSSRPMGFVQPIRDSAVVRIVDDEGRPVSLVATTSAAGVYSTLMSEEERQLPVFGGVHLTAELEKNRAERILLDSRQHELNQLRTAWEMGFLDSDRYAQEFDGTMKRFAAASRDYPRQKWSFEKKRLVRA